MTAAHQLGSAAIPEAQHTIPPTPRGDLDRIIAGLHAKKDAWLKLEIPERMQLVTEMMRDLRVAAPRWVAAALKAKGITPGSPQEGEEWLGGPFVTARILRQTRDSLRAISNEGAPTIPGGTYVRPGGQVVARVFPYDLFDKLNYTGFSGEVWMEPGVTLSNLRETQAVTYRNKPKAGKVALVLGAGNVSSIGPLDAIYKLFVEDQVCVIKMNPVNEYLGPYFEDAFRALIERGYLQIVYGGAAEGAYLCQHEGIDEIHITGSDKTHDAIVFGVGPEGAARKARREPILTKRVTSELGNVSPVIVVPGPWSESDLEAQGVNLASMLTNNAGFNCNALRMIIQHRPWSLRQQLLDAVGRALENAPTRKAYYPGAFDRWQSFVDAHPDARKFGHAPEGALPWTLVPDVDPRNGDDICFQTEAFCGVAGETALDAATVVEFIDKAVDFCNDRVWGQLNAAIVVHPASLKDPAVAEAVDRAIANLRYGSIGVNHWPALSYGLGTTTWGAYPGNDIYNVGSGVGIVHNTLMFDRVQKSVVKGPFRTPIKMPWMVNFTKGAELGPKVLDFELEPSLLKLPSMLWTVLRG